MSRYLDPEIARIGREKRMKNADEFAQNTQKIITQLKTAENITSYRDTVKLLNDNKVPTYLGGKWRVCTLYNLYKRCKKLDPQNG